VESFSLLAFHKEWQIYDESDIISQSGVPTQRECQSVKYSGKFQSLLSPERKVMELFVHATLGSVDLMANRGRGAAAGRGPIRA
jgi:hypothetical protein